jgi:hypothetical protein
VKTESIIAVAGALTGGRLRGARRPAQPLRAKPAVPVPRQRTRLVGSEYGGYCEGKTFPDGTRLNVYRLGYFWQPIRCIIPDGSMTPPLAPPGGCAGLLG